MAQRGARSRGTLGLVVTTLALGLAGCRWLPDRRPSAALDPRQVVADPPDTPSPILAASPDPADPDRVPLPTLPLQPLSDAEALAAVPPTPQLDSALARAHAIQETVVAEVVEPPEPPPPPPPRSLPTPRPTPAPDPDAPAVAEAPAPRDEAVQKASTVAVTVAEPDPAPEPEPDPAPEPEPVEPEDAWREALDRLLALARAQADAEPSPGGLWSARATILARLDEADEADAAEVLRQAILASQAEPEPEPQPAPEPPDEPELAIAALEVCRKVEGFGLYEPAEPDSIRAGSEVLLYWEVEGLAAEHDGDLYRTRLASTVAILPAEGDEPAWSQPLGTAEDDCRRPRRDYFVNGRITLPDDLPPGAYRLRLTLDDLNSGRSTVREVPLTLAP